MALVKNKRKLRGARLLADDCVAEYPLAEELKDTGVWLARPKGSPPKVGRKPILRSAQEAFTPVGDRTRINIVNHELVRDTINYLKPTLARHAGCDLISVYPGAGLWTTALHDAVQPRSHLLLETDEELYRPFLDSLLQKPGVRLVPKSGIIWEELNKILTPEYLPHQVEIPRTYSDPIPRNDTLLVSMNLCMFPKRRYRLFDSISRMVVYQLISTLRTSSLFQKYGRVRMLIWIPDDEKNQVLPRVLHHRARLAIEAELSTEYIAEVCGDDSSANPQGKPNLKRDLILNKISSHDAEKKSREEKGWSTKRWGQVDMESTRLVLNRMRDARMKTPKGRKTFHMEKFKKLKLAMSRPVNLDKFLILSPRQTEMELKDLLQKDSEKPLVNGTAEWKRLHQIRHYHSRLDRELEHALNFVQGSRELARLKHRAATAVKDAERKKLAKEARQYEEKWDEAYTKLPMYLSHSCTSARDMFHLLEQPEDLGPVLNWDRRPYEPLPVKRTDFFPNVPCALLDICPKSVDPLLRAGMREGKNAADIFDLMLGVFLAQRRKPVQELMEGVWPGTSEGILEGCTSLRDPARGGIDTTGPSSISARVLNQVQLLEIVREFMRWPFRPSYQELLGRHSEDGDDLSLSKGTVEEEHPMGNMTVDAF